MDWFLYDNDPVMKQLKGFIKYNLTGGRRNIWVKLCLFHFQFFCISDFFISDFNSFQLKEFKWDCALYFLLSCFDIKLFSLVQFVPLFLDFSDFIYFFFHLFFISFYFCFYHWLLLAKGLETLLLVRTIWYTIFRKTNISYPLIRTCTWPHCMQNLIELCWSFFVSPKVKHRGEHKGNFLPPIGYWIIFFQAVWSFELHLFSDNVIYFYKFWPIRKIWSGSSDIWSFFGEGMENIDRFWKLFHRFLFEMSF